LFEVFQKRCKKPFGEIGEEIFVGLTSIPAADNRTDVPSQPMEWPQALLVLLAGIISGFLTVTAGAAVTVVFPVLTAVGLSADAANATSRFRLSTGFREVAISYLLAVRHLGD
jgi:hypothetical protein